MTNYPVLSAECCAYCFVIARACWLTYKAILLIVNGTIKWKWEMKAFCESQSANGEVQGYFRSAYVIVRDVMLESAFCTKIQMDVLNCEYDLVDTTNGAQEWYSETFVNKPNGTIFTLHSLPKTSQCYVSPIDVIYYEISEGERRPLTTYRNQGQRSELKREFFESKPPHTEKLLAEFYESKMYEKSKQ